MTRRDFVGSVAAGAATLAVAPKRLFAASDRIRYGIIGVGDRGQQDLRDALACPGTECVAVADIYSRRRDQAKALARSIQTDGQGQIRTATQRNITSMLSSRASSSERTFALMM